MSEHSHIEWTDATWNFLAGCTKKSAGCKNCYAIRTANRLQHNPNPKVSKKYEGTVTPDGKNWTGRINFDEESLTLPASWKDPLRIFVNSVSDLFHPNVSETVIGRAFAFMAWCNHHTYQILTKHPERAKGVLARLGRSFLKRDEDWPLSNVWLGVSVENQTEADERIPLLLQTDAAVRWLSCEPLLEGVILQGDGNYGRPDDLHGRAYLRGETPDWRDHRPGIDWVVVGGESGPGARACELAWIRSVVSQCEAAQVPVFVKQLGSRFAVNYYDTEFREEYEANGWDWPEPMEWDTRHGQPPLGSRVHIKLKDRKGGDLNEAPEDIRVRQFPVAH